MPTIAEIIAAKKAAAASQPVAPTVKESLTVDPMLEAAINRIDPPGKRKGLVVSAKPLPAPATTPQQPAQPERRAISQTFSEAINMTPVEADAEETTWHEAMTAFESQLCVMRDPNEPDVIWLAVRPNRQGLPPILIHRLPWTLWEHPSANKDPF